MKKKTQEKEESRQQTEERTDKPEDQAPVDSSEGNEAKQNEPAEAEAKPASDKAAAEIKALEEKLAETQDKYLRLSAEFDNYRKRTLREKMELSKYAEENLLSKLLPFMDDFDRAIQHMDSTDAEAVKTGIDLIYSRFSDFLKQNGIKEIEAKDSDFNVDLHEAVAKVPAGEPSNKGKIMDVVLKGYYLRDKVLRFSKVVVGE